MLVLDHEHLPFELFAVYFIVLDLNFLSAQVL